MVHAIHGMKPYQVSFPTQPTTRHLDFPRWSYCQNTEDSAEDQQPRGNYSETHFVEACSHSLPFLFLFVFNLSRRAVPSINIHILLSKRGLLIIKIQNPPFVQLCANKYWEWSLPLCSCDFLCGIYRSGGFIRSQLVLLLPSRFTLIDCRLCWLVSWECGWANPRYRLPVKDGVWLRVLFARLH